MDCMMDGWHNVEIDEQRHQSSTNEFQQRHGIHFVHDQQY